MNASTQPSELQASERSARTVAREKKEIREAEPAASVMRAKEDEKRPHVVHRGGGDILG